MQYKILKVKMYIFLIYFIHLPDITDTFLVLHEDTFSVSDYNDMWVSIMSENMSEKIIVASYEVLTLQLLWAVDENHEGTPSKELVCTRHTKITEQESHPVYLDDLLRSAAV